MLGRGVYPPEVMNITHIPFAVAEIFPSFSFNLVNTCKYNCFFFISINRSDYFSLVISTVNNIHKLDIMALVITLYCKKIMPLISIIIRYNGMKMGFPKEVPYICMPLYPQIIVYSSMPLILDVVDSIAAYPSICLSSFCLFICGL